MPPRSLPAPGSLKPWHHRTVDDSRPGRCRRFCSSVPKRRMALEMWPMAGGGGAPARPISSLRIASYTGDIPCPPYSTGKASPIHPAS
jgi:hypothetical protein